MEVLGALDFFEMAGDLYSASKIKPSTGIWFSPGSRHYSWDKGANILNLGRNNLKKISVDEFCRMDLKELKEGLQECLEKKKPVIGVTAVFGTTQEGAVDDLEGILQMKKEFAEKGLTFYVHVDGAWGGYFASCVSDRQARPIQPTIVGGRRTVQHEAHDKAKRVGSGNGAGASCGRFLDSKLSRHFTWQLWCLKEANSVTLDPHKSGFCPYPAGGLLYRNGNIRNFLAQSAAYVSHGEGKNEEINLYGIDGSKPGAASAGVWLSHKVIGLHHEGYGLILRQSTLSGK